MSSVDTLKNGMKLVTRYKGILITKRVKNNIEQFGFGENPLIWFSKKQFEKIINI